MNTRFSFLRDVLGAAALPARDRAVAPFDRGSHHAAALSWADGDAAWANADGGVIAPTVPIVSVGAVIAVPPDLNIDALGHLEILGLGRSSETAKLHGLDPQAYLADILGKIVNGWPMANIDALFPWAWADRHGGGRLAA